MENRGSIRLGIKCSLLVGNQNVPFLFRLHILHPLQPYTIAVGSSYYYAYDCNLVYWNIQVDLLGCSPRNFARQNCHGILVLATQFHPIYHSRIHFKSLSLNSFWSRSECVYGWSSGILGWLGKLVISFFGKNPMNNGTISDGFQNLTSLRELSLDAMQLQGGILTWIGDLSDLKQILEATRRLSQGWLLQARWVDLLDAEWQQTHWSCSRRLGVTERIA